MFLELTLAALLSGAGALAAGWLLWGRGLSAAKASLVEARVRLAEAQVQERAALLRAEEIASGMDDARDALEHERQQRMALQTRLAAVEAQAQEREQAISAQIAQLTEVRGQLQKDFEALAHTALRQNEAQFLRMAEETMKRHREGSSADLAKTRAELEALLNPVKDTLTRYQQGLGDVEKARVEAYGSLKQQIETMLKDQGQLRAETQKLVHALKSGPKARGRWGEQQLRNVLEMAGLSPYVDFQTEVHVATAEDGALRPDAIVRLPGGRQLIVDAKTSLNAFLEAADCADDGERAAHLLAHARALKTHAEQLGQKAYWKQFGDSADFVVMFVPGEHFVTAALEVEPGLWEFAFQRRVLIATPTNLIALARTVSHVWQQEKLAEQAQEIGALGKELYKRMRAMGNHVLDLGKALDGTVKKYNSFVGSLERSVMPQARKFAELQFDASAEPLAVAEQSETAVRLPDQRGRDLTFDGDTLITAPPAVTASATAALPRTEVAADAEE